jgi:hypothetical protein
VLRLVPEDVFARALERLRRRYPGAELTALVSDRTTGPPGRRATIVATSGALGRPLAYLNLIRQLRRSRWAAAAAVMTPNDLRPAAVLAGLFVALSGAREKLLVSPGREIRPVTLPSLLAGVLGRLIGSVVYAVVALAVAAAVVKIVALGMLVTDLAAALLGRPAERSR